MLYFDVLWAKVFYPVCVGHTWAHMQTDARCVLMWIRYIGCVLMIALETERKKRVTQYLNSWQWSSLCVLC